MFKLQLVKVIEINSQSKVKESECSKEYKIQFMNNVLSPTEMWGGFGRLWPKSTEVGIQIL